MPAHAPSPSRFRAADKALTRATTAGAAARASGGGARELVGLLLEAGEQPLVGLDLQQLVELQADAGDPAGLEAAHHQLAAGDRAASASSVGLAAEPRRPPSRRRVMLGVVRRRSRGRRTARPRRPGSRRGSRSSPKSRPSRRATSRALAEQACRGAAAGRARPGSSSSRRAAAPRRPAASRMWPLRTTISDARPGRQPAEAEDHAVGGHRVADDLLLGLAGDVDLDPADRVRRLPERHAEPARGRWSASSPAPAARTARRRRRC